MRTSDLEYELPDERIATEPARPRDSARLMLVEGDAPARHLRVADLPGLVGTALSPGDLLVFNTTRVVPARFLGLREDTGGKVQGLYLGPAPAEREDAAGSWSVMLKARRFKVGAPIRLKDRTGEPSNVVLTIRDRESSDGAWIVDVRVGGAPLDSGATLEVLSRVGLTPLPPYILGARRDRHFATDDDADRRWYQTVLARQPGSVAAPTAGMHFTEALLDELASRGLSRAEVVLHVGAGTFKPVEADTLEDHQMHTEWCAIEADQAERIRLVKASGGRVIAIGTTTARTLESHSEALLSGVDPVPMETRLMIAPGYTWRVCDGLLTNFHLPRSTLLALVAAMMPGGIGRVKAVYAEAIREGYRFYSYGDAMLILPGSPAV